MGVGEQQDKNKPNTFALFSPFETQIEVFCFLCFCCITDSPHPFHVLSQRRKKMKKIIKEMGMGEKKREAQLMAYIPPQT